MSITLAPETEDRLREVAQAEGRDMDALANEMLLAMLEREAQERQENVAAFRAADADYEAGRVRPWSEFAAEMRAKYELPTHLSDEELFRSL